MILWQEELKQLGFRQRSAHYWQCRRGYGLSDDTHLSVFVTPARGTCGWNPRRKRKRVAFGYYEVTEFHVTFCVSGHHLHFYYHEIDVAIWGLGGHTPTVEARHLGWEMSQLREASDPIAARFVADLGGELKGFEGLA